MIPVVGISVWLVVKIFAILAFLLYLLFALVIVRQVKLMTDTLRDGSEGMLKSLAFAHLIFAGIVFGLSFILL